ncbi:hypothetical protein BOX15_Mlig024355g2 [Macrostomum lignano]|uniref:Uncharacterized protein n=1 Tax=Macrostomum lignano TaxID=282301 RepID=A0A267GFL6_9PLAT|nr:hypothetical protein BOX15_Mlig024355g2 [Macrostomum lignano]
MQQPWNYNLGLSFQCGDGAYNGVGCGGNENDGCVSQGTQQYSADSALMFPQQFYANDSFGSDQYQQQNLLEQFQLQPQQQEQQFMSEMNLMTPNNFIMMQQEQQEQPDDNELLGDGGSGGMCNVMSCCGMAQSGGFDGMQAGGWPMQMPMAAGDMQFGMQMQSVCSDGGGFNSGSGMCCGFGGDSNGGSCNGGEMSSVLSMQGFGGCNPWQRPAGMLPDI